MKEELCKAFCGDLVVREVPDGLAIRTGFSRPDGDSIGFFIVPDKVLSNHFRIEDDGTTVPFLESCGVDFTTSSRATAFQELLSEYGAEFDETEVTIRTAPLTDDDVPRAAMKFVALMLRSLDFLLLTQDRVFSTFKEDAIVRIRKRLGDRVAITEGEPVSDQLSDAVPDLVIRAPKRAPVALFFVTTAQRINDAIFLHMSALYETKEELAVIALLEGETNFSNSLLRRAANRLAALPSYHRGDEKAAVNPIEQEALGRSALLH